MRICFLCNEYPPAPHGGIGVFTRVLGHALVRAGHQVRVLGILRPRAEAAEYEEDEGVRVWRLRPARPRLSWFRARYMLARVATRWARAGEIDLIEAPDYEGWTAGWPPLRVPVVVRLHGSLSYFDSEMGRRVPPSVYCIERAALERADFLCSVSRYTAERTRRLFRLAVPEIAVLYNAVEVPAELPPVTRSATDVVFSGTLAAKKGVQSLVRAWPLVRRTCGDAVLHIYGKDGRTDAGASVRSSLETQLNGTGPSVCFHGHVGRETLLAALAAARAAVFPSYAEAFAIAPLEAMAQGCPTIYSRRGSGPELIRDGTDGLLVDPANPGEIAGAIESLLRDSALAARLGQAGRCRALNQFSCGVLVRRNEEFYRSCLVRYRSR